VKKQCDAENTIEGIINFYKEKISVIDEPNTSKIEAKILDTVLKAQFDKIKKIKYSMIWDSYEISKKELLAYFNKGFENKKVMTILIKK
jgi:hypothetical protein